ncbi:MAG TPA: hypothetical protein VIX12_06485, partial [Candidatus Binataceae bacterium]
MAIQSELRDLIQQQLPGDSARQLTLFAERLFARESSDLAKIISPQRRFELAKSAFEFFSVRTGPIAVRVFPDAGQEAAVTVETVMQDRPFIIDSLLEYFHHLGAPAHVLLHPVYHVTRDTDGHIVSFEQTLASERGESFVHAELETSSGS